MFGKLRVVLFLELVWLFTALPAMAQVSVLTFHNDVGRTGQNNSETTLTTSNVKVGTFGKLFWRTVDGHIYTQPLYVPNLTVQGKTRNVVYVATQHNSVYAFDADDPTVPAPLWQVNLGTAVPSQDICTISGDTNPGDCPYLDIPPEIGITSTPVIDSLAGLIYVVARTKNTSNNSYHFSLHALDLITGIEKLGGPAEITGHVTGGGVASSGGIVTFDPIYHLQRPGLLLLNGVIYIAFSAVGDIGPYHGWLMGYDATSLQQVSILNMTPDGKDGGIWAAGFGIASDGLSNIFLATGNGNFDANVSGRDYGDSILRISTSSGLTVADYFTPSNQATLFSSDLDLGSGGPMLLPGTTNLVNIGKDQLLRLVNTAPTKMGHFNSGFDADVQQFTAAQSSYFGGPVYWNSPNNGPVVYLWGPKDPLKAFKYTGGLFQTTPVSQSTVVNSSGFSNSAALSVSSNSGLVGSGILWSAASFSGTATGPGVPGILRAFDATNLGTELWDSKQNAARDDAGTYAKFVPPTIANGKMYAGSFSGQLLVYGVNPPAASGIRYVQVASSTQTSSTASVSASYPSAQTAGDLNVVVISWSDATSAVQTVADSQGNPYSLAIGPTTGTGMRQSIYYAKNIKTGSNSVTVTFNQSANSPDLRILEYSGVDTTSPLDGSLGANGTSAFADSGFTAFANANDLIIGADITGAKNIVPGSPFTNRALTTSTSSHIVEDRIVNVTGSYHAWAPLLSSVPWVMQMVAFKAGGSVTGTGPVVGGVAPSSGTAAGGTVVTITGANFAAGATVSFGGTAAASVTVVSSTSITATAPAHAAGAVTVTVTNTNGQSGSLSNAYAYTAVVTGSIAQVQVNAATPQNPTASVAVNYPVAQTAGDLNVVAVGWNDTTSTVSSVTDTRGNTYALAIGPNTGTGLRQSIYYAKNIAAGANTVTVTFSQAAAVPDIRVLEYSGLDAVTPLDATAGAAGNSAAASSGNATTTKANELIFGAGMTARHFNSAGTGFTSRIITTPDGDIAEDQIVGSTGSYSATAPLASGNWVMQMATFAAASAPAPTITGIAPSNGPTSGGTEVTITGTNFVTGATVTFGGIAATNVSVVKAGVISALTPAGTGVVAVVVTNPDHQSATLTSAYTYGAGNPAPTVTTVSPTSGTTAGGTPVTITGTGFLTGATVTFGGTSATAVTVVNSTSITATTPAHASGAVDVVVTNTDIQSGTKTSGYTYTSPNPAPTVSTIAPTSGTTAGGTAVTITGTGFLAGATVSFGGTPATGVTVVNSTSITATTPAHAAGAVDVVVTNTDSQSGTKTSGYTYTSPNPAPTVSTIAPTSGTTAGGTAVTITGTGFLTGATVSFGGTAATGVTVVNSTSITATTPAHAAGAVNVVVTNSDTQTGTLTNGYTYTTSGGGGTIAFVQVKAATPQTNSASVAVAYPLAQTLGNLNIVAVGWNDTTATVTSVTDSRGNAYTLAIGPTSGTGLRQSIYYAKNIAAGANTVTVNFSQAAVFVDVRVLEYSGLDTTNPLDVTAGASGSGTSPTTAAATTTTASELIFGAGMTTTHFTGPGTGFTSRIITTPDSDIAEDKIVSSTGSYNVAAPVTSSFWVMQMATFRLAQ